MQNRQGFFEDKGSRDYPCIPSSPSISRILMDMGFDMGTSQRLPEGEGEGHAIAYVHRRVMDASKPVPAVPIFLNTYFPPNQPRPKRCYEFGQAVRKAVEAFPGDERIGVLASGGLSHFLVDEDLDRAILKACADKDANPSDAAAQQAASRARPNPQLGRGGRRVEHLDLDWFEYVPGYRTPAGTGTGMSFASWT